MRYRFCTLDVFTDRLFGGNPLAVFPDGAGLTTEQMQAVARELNLSETVFVFPPGSAAETRRLRIFTPGAELPFAGHPTVGTAFALALLGEIELTGDHTDIVFGEGVGPVPVAIAADSGRPTSATLSAAAMPEVRATGVSAAEIAEVLSLDPEVIATGELAPQAVSCGVPFLFVPVRSLEALGSIVVDLAAWKRHVADTWAPHLFVFHGDGKRAGEPLRARMFAPAMGIAEDPATGAAVTALGGYLALDEASGDGTYAWVVEQGVEMGRPSTLHVEADKREGAVTGIRVGGSAVLVSEGEMEIR